MPWKDISQSRLRLFQSLLPCPSNLDGQEQYYWALENWGVKWDCFVEIVDCNDSYLELQFDTPWTTPKIGINAIASMFPNLSFDLNSSEPGCDWQASFSWQLGELIKEINGSFYQQSPLICPECNSNYHPEIDLDGNIIYSECFECGWTD